MIEENQNGQIDIEHLRKIRDVLLSFEKEYQEKCTKKGVKILKKEYIHNRITL